VNKSDRESTGGILEWVFNWNICLGHCEVFLCSAVLIRKASIILKSSHSMHPSNTNPSILLYTLQHTNASIQLSKEKYGSYCPTIEPPNWHSPIERNLILASQFRDIMPTNCVFCTNCALPQDFHQIALHTSRETWGLGLYRITRYHIF
jgi:hypothetical protein